VSASTIHKIENLQTTPTITVVLKIAKGLGRQPSELLNDVELGEPVSILRHEDRPQAQFGEAGELDFVIDRIPRGELGLWRVRLASGIGVGMPGSEPWQFPGEMALLIEEGSVEINIRGESHELNAGDSIHFDSSLPHRWFATGAGPAMLIVTAILPERVQLALMALMAGADDERDPKQCLNEPGSTIRS